MPDQARTPSRYRVARCGPFILLSAPTFRPCAVSLKSLRAYGPLPADRFSMLIDDSTCCWNVAASVLKSFNSGGKHVSIWLASTYDA
ncbi:hypothetical protein DACRYDRAFT_20499 [Dacryopinax primogenitus]|uniref:Uncharacterized protein n=1 Tax=Dacryopinax primogenitus (strain DJM 731) TaxID=1858805 RepID=M5G9H7_DACPD|nr:uncharacterized protein DACRYDRAFT_20499 [Dacryopinax primogenitus]EJU04905.1 hypothetical protein DACRYDRAFT_20499 [Dacryopinax primogenitus]